MMTKDQMLDLILVEDEDRYHYIEQFLKNMPEDILPDLHYIEVSKGDSIICAGDSCGSIYILLSGEIKGVDYYKTGSTYSFLDFSRMYILGDFELFSELPEYQASIYANTDCKLLKMAADQYLRWIQHDENALFLRLKHILKTLTMERRKDREYLRMSCKERLIDYLVHYFEKEENPDQKSVRIALTQSELSEKIGFNIRSVQRAVASLESSELVSIESGKMILAYDQYLQLKDMDDSGKQNG